MAQHIKDIVTTIFNQSHDWRMILLRDWALILGDVAQHVQLHKIEHDTLILHVHNACWMHELYMLSPLLLKTINKRLDQPYIKRLRFKQAGTEKKREELKKSHVPQAYRSLMISPREQEALLAIVDPQLQGAIKQFLYRCKREKE